MSDGLWVWAAGWLAGLMMSALGHGREGPHTHTTEAQAALVQLAANPSGPPPADSVEDIPEHTTSAQAALVELARRQAKAARAPAQVDAGKESAAQSKLSLMRLAARKGVLEPEEAERVMTGAAPVPPEEAAPPATSTTPATGGEPRAVEPVPPAVMLYPARTSVPTTPVLAPSPVRSESVRFGRLGTVVVTRTEAAPLTAALLLADGDPARGRAAEQARVLAEHGALVLAFDAREYLRTLEKGPKCAYLAGDLEVLSQGYQHHIGLPEYLHPTLVGDGAGAQLAYVALAQAPAGTFRGAVGLDFQRELNSTVVLCSGASLNRGHIGSSRRDRLEPVRDLAQPWVLLVAQDDEVHPPRLAREFTGLMRTGRVVEVPGSALSRLPLEQWKAPFTVAYDLAARPLPSEAKPDPKKQKPPKPPPATAKAPAPGKVSAKPAPVAPAATTAPPAGVLADVTDLPLEELPVKDSTGDTLALFVTGDGGWASLDKEVSKVFTAQGIPVVGLNSLRYFWKRRTAQETSADVSRVLRHYLSTWNKTRVLLVGYSRGADLAPAIASHLPKDLKDRLRLVALLAPGQEAEFEVHVTDIFGGKGRETQPVLPEVRALGDLPLLCLYGADEASESLCPQLANLPGKSAVSLKGGHHFDGDHAALAKLILEALPP